MRNTDAATQIILRKWLIFSLGKSTAIVMPILPIFLLDERGLPIEHMLSIASYFVLLPVVFDIPAGWIGDKFGHRQVLISGTILFLIGFCCIAVDLPFGYSAYLIFIGLAAACYSGCEPIYLKSLLPANLDFTLVLSRVNERVYLLSSVMLIMGGGFYMISPALPVVFQIALLGSATLALCSLPNSACEEVNTVEAISTSSRQLTSPVHPFILAAVMSTAYCGLFTGFVQLTSRTVQIQLAHHAGELPYLKLGLVFALGNLFSATGARLVRTALVRLSGEHMLALAAAIAAAAAWLLSGNSPSNIFSGFLLLCVFKGFYRPVLTKKITAVARSFFKTQASVYSTINVSAIAIAAGIHWLAAFLYVDMHQLFQWLALTLLVGGGLLFFVDRGWRSESEFLQFNANGKRGATIYRWHKPHSFIQEYLDAGPSTLKIVVAHSKAGYMPAPNMYCRAPFLVSQYVGGKRLTECASDIQHYIVQRMTASMFQGIAIAQRSAVYPHLETIFTPSNLSALPNDNRLIHADLHPDNVLITGHDFQVIDWDSSGNGNVYFDLFTLVTSPRLRFEDEERIRLISECARTDSCTATKLIAEFLLWKFRQMAELATTNPEFASIASEYATFVENWITKYGIPSRSTHEIL